MSCCKGTRTIWLNGFGYVFCSCGLRFIGPVA